MAGSHSNEYFSNLLSLLNLRIFSCLGLCDQEKQIEAHDRIASITDHSLQDGFIPDEEEMGIYRELTEAAEEEHIALLKAAEADGSQPAIEALRSKFSLDSNELFLLTAILAPSADSRFGKIYRSFQGSEGPRMDFLLSLIEPDGIRKFEYAKLLGRDGKLLSCGLAVTDGANTVPSSATVYLPAPGILEWLSGVRSVDFYCGRAEWLEEPAKRIASDSAEVSMATALKMAEISREPLPIISFYGPDDELLEDHAETLAAEMGRSVLKLDMNGLSPADSMLILRIAMRDTLLNDAVPVFSGLLNWFDPGGVLPSEVADLFNSWQVPVVLLTDRPAVFPQNKKGLNRLMLGKSVEGMTGSQRFRVWKKQLQDLPLSEDISDETLRTLAGQFTLNSTQIRAAVNSGLGIAVMEDRELRVGDLYSGARVSSMHHLSDLAKQMPTKYTLKDLILPEKQKREIDKLIAMAKNRSMVLEDWGVGKKLVSGRGISALFTGVPGTGKTLSAQAIAGELGLELYRVDLSTIISKYIGETEKNLERIFTEAQNSNVILFFDEADSLFGRRSEVNDSHDRYANIEVGYLLQRIETYDGIVLMATNLGANLDEAFARRIHFIIDFPFPDEETRLRLWQLLLPDNIEKDPDIDLASFAAVYKIAGGNIRNAVVWAIYDSANNKRPLSREDLLRGVEREYQKMGKVFISIG